MATSLNNKGTADSTNINIFNNIPAENIEILTRSLRTRTYNKGDVIFREGSNDQNLFIIQDGRVKLTRTSYDHRTQLLSVHGSGEILGEIPVFDPQGGSRTASAVVITNNTYIASLSRATLFTWLDKFPLGSIDFLQLLAHRMRKNNERIADLVFTDVAGRLAKTLLDLSSKFGVHTDDGLIVPHDLTQEELAQLVGSSRETVNKALTEFAHRRWIERRNRVIIILQPEKLSHRIRQ